MGFPHHFLSFPQVQSPEAPRHSAGCTASGQGRNGSSGTKQDVSGPQIFCIDQE